MKSKEIISQMKCIGTEADGGLVTYGENGDDYNSARDFVVIQAWNMNNLKKYTERLGYYPGQPRGHQTFEDMLNDFADWWNDPDAEEWYDLAANYFDGHERGVKNE